MRTLIRSEGFEASNALREHVIQRLNFLLQPFGGDLDQITVHLENCTASQPDSQRVCRITAEIRCHTVMVEERKSHFGLAFDSALKRLLYSIWSSLKAEREAIASAVLHENRG
jgi:ribosome-associated translation inhibitor RaiA